MTITTILFFALAVIVTLMLLLWLISGKGKDAAWVDFGWAVCIGLCAVIFAYFSTGDLNRRIILGTLPVLWALRLAIHLLKDRVLGPHKDGRYDYLKKSWGINYQIKFLLFFQVQAILAFLLSLPFLLGGFAIEPLSLVAFCLGSSLFVIALTGETIADKQLAKFKASPSNKGKVCQSGLWKYSRHPNYFFEWLHWVSYILLLSDTSWWWTSAIIAGVMLYLVLYVTGIPPTEEQSLRSRGMAYSEYQATTSSFFPWFPKRRIINVFK